MENNELIARPALAAEVDISWNKSIKTFCSGLYIVCDTSYERIQRQEKKLLPVTKLHNLVCEMVAYYSR